MKSSDIPIAVTYSNEAERDFALSVMRDTTTYASEITGWAAIEDIPKIEESGCIVDVASQPGTDVSPVPDDAVAAGGVFAIWTRWGIGGDLLTQLAEAGAEVIARLPAAGYQYAFRVKPGALPDVLALPFVACAREITQAERDAQARYQGNRGPNILE